MACREGSNSVVVSLAYFLTKSEGRNSRADDALVKKAFHALRIEQAAAHRTAAQLAAEDTSLPPARRHALLAIGSQYPPADAADVLAFLREQQHVAQTDPRVPDGRRAALLSRLAAAEQAVRDGTAVPTVDVFGAWRGLRARTEQMRAEGRVPAGVTAASGQVVTREDVEAAVAERDAAIAALEALYSAGRAHGMIGSLQQQVEAAKSRVLAAEAALLDRTRDYDTTEDGLQELLALAGALDAYIPADRAERARAAREERHRIATVTDDAVREQADAFRALEREYMRARAVGDHEAMNRLAPRYDQARFNYSRILLLSPRMRPAMDSEDDWEQSPAAWAAIRDDPDPGGPTRREGWIAVETYASARDARKVRAGDLPADRARARARARAACRQAILDAEAAA